MATLLSTSTAITVMLPGTATLAQLGASMAPGTWAELTTNGINAALLSSGNGGGVGGNNIPYANQMAWNPIAQKIQFAGSDHNAAYMPEIAYDLATNAWNIVVGTGFPNGTHGWSPVVRPDTGDRYNRYNGGGNATQPLYRKLTSGGNWTLISPASPVAYTQIGVGACWWPGSNTGRTALSGMGAAGCYIVLELSLGTLLCFDTLANAWTVLPSPPINPPIDPYHTVAAYSPQFNCVVYGGGNGSGGRNLRMFRLNQDRSVTELTACPVGIGIQAANLQVDPVTGKFLIWGGGSNARKFYELNPTGIGTYTLLGGTRQPPAAGSHGVSDPSGGAGGPDALVSCALPAHGVIAYISASGASYANMFLYKHA